MKGEKAKEEKGLSIIVPVYNEREAIEDILIGLSNIKDNIDSEIIVVNDGSIDGTTEIIEQKINDKEITLLKCPVNKGYGASIKAGMKVSLHPWICIVDADGSYPIEKIPELFNEVNDCDMVIGARTGKDAYQVWNRKPAKWFITKLANYLLRIKIQDINSGLRIFRKEDAEKFIHMLPEGFSFTTTITLCFLSNN